MYSPRYAVQRGHCIFEVVLGGTTWHIPYDIDDNKLYRSLCQRPVQEEDDAQVIKRAMNGEKSHLLRHYRHENYCNGGEKGEDYVPPPSRITLILVRLQTHRDFHSDAALLPFTLNTFSFTDRLDPQQFIRHLIPERNRAVKSISMTFDGIDNTLIFPLSPSARNRHAHTPTKHAQAFPKFQIGWEEAFGDSVVFELLEVGKIVVVAYGATEPEYDGDESDFFEDEEGFVDASAPLEWAGNAKKVLKKKYDDEEEEKEEAKV